MTEASDAFNVIRRGCVEIISAAELKAKLALGRPLLIKAGFDPTAPDLHLGHTVLLRKLRHFQDLGHKVIFLIGDATALVGDPSGQSKTRPVLMPQQVEENAKTYVDQVSKILSTDQQVFEICRNSDWFLPIMDARAHGESAQFGFFQLLELFSHYTVARLIEREEFKKRLKAGQELTMFEFFYPLMQGYDSVQIAKRYGHCDVELGGTDQTFNLLVGRDLMRSYGHEPQVVLTMPLLEGLDGVQKMSKSLGNHVGIREEPKEMFGKLMSIPDGLLIRYFTLLTDLRETLLQGLDRHLQAHQINPRDVKIDLATMIVKQYHDDETAMQVRDEFIRVFSKRQLPADMPTVTVSANGDEGVDMVELLVAEKLAKTKNDARRLIKQGGVKLNGTPIRGPRVPLASADGAVLQVGSRHFRKLAAKAA